MKAFLLSGTVHGERGCSAPYAITVEKKVRGRADYVELANLSTDAEGRWSFEREAQRSATYVVAVSSKPGCRGDRSAPVEVGVKVKLAGLAICRHGDGINEEGEHFVCCFSSRISGRMAPVHPGSKVRWKIRRNGRWIVQDSDRVSRDGAFHLSDRGRDSCGGHRLVWPQQRPANLRTVRSGV